MMHNDLTQKFLASWFNFLHDAKRELAETDTESDPIRRAIMQKDVKDRIAHIEMKIDRIMGRL